jgi:MYXO-CTERM domain-containing protein
MKLAAATTLAAALSVAPAVHAATVVSAVRETQKIRPTDPAPTAQSSIALSCARNEFCAFQIAVTAPSGAALTVSDVALGDLASPCATTITGASALVYREGFLDVTTPSNSAGTTGQWPDPLIPKVDAFYGETRNAFPAQIAAGQTQGFWVEMLIPTDQPAGTYAGSATVTNADATTAEISVSIQVRDFTLPSTSSLGSVYGFDWDGPCQGHFGGYGGASCDDAQLEALNALYFRDALNHRITISSLVYAPPITNGQGDFTTFDTLYGPFLDGTALTGKNALVGAKITAITYSGDQVAASYAAWATHFKAKGWFDRVFDYTCDEPPNGCAWTDIPTRAAIVHMGDPDFRTLTTTSIQAATQNGVLSSIDILVPIINYMDGAQDDPYPGDQRASYDTFLQGANSLLWMYQSCEPSSSCSNGDVDGAVGWPTMFIDESAISNRMMQWMEFKYQVSADLYYDTTQAMDTQDAWTSQYEFGNNGDGSIWYPGKPSVIGGTHDIPVESIRMKMLREGMQDYEYLNLLTTLGDGAFAQTELAKVVTSAGSFASDPSVLEGARLEMAAEIEKDVAMLVDGGVNEACDGGATTPGDGGSGGDASSGGADGSVADSGTSTNDASGGSNGGCGCRAANRAPSPSGGLIALAVAVGAVARRRRGVKS